MTLCILLYALMTCVPVDLVFGSSTILYSRILSSEFISDRRNALIEGMDHFPSVKLWWDFFKNPLRAEIIFFSKTKRKNLSHESVVLTNEVIKLKSLLVAGDFSVSPVIRDLENKLKEIVLKDLSGVAMRSKARWLEEGEKPSRFFFRQA